VGLFQGFVAGTYQDGKADAQRAINLIPEPVESQTGITQIKFRGAPGKHTWATLPTTPVRGLWAGYNRLFAVGGSKLYEMSNVGGATLLGDVGDDAAHSPVEIYPNGNQIGIISAGAVYCDSGAGPVAATFTEDSTAVTASQGAFLDTFLIVGKPNTKEYFISASNDFSSWSNLDFSSKEGYPDPIIALLADHEEIWFWGTETTEAHRNEGGELFPFQRDPGAFNHLGIAAPFSRARLDSNIFALVADARGKIWAARFQGFMPKRISTHAIEAAWAGYSTVLDAEAFSYTENGHSYWHITFPTANATWCYDNTTGMWHERAWWDGSALQRDRARGHAYVFGKHFVGDYSNGKIYEQSESIYDDFGSDRVYIRNAPYVAVDQNQVFHHRLQALIESGGAATVAASLAWSDDEGTNYRTAITKTAPIGAHRFRFLWRRLGESRQRIYQLRLQTQQKVAIAGALLDVTPGNH
jgi:hypothetical protein